MEETEAEGGARGTNHKERARTVSQGGSTASLRQSRLGTHPAAQIVGARTTAGSCRGWASRTKRKKKKAAMILCPARR